jgi:uncharacterized protein (DUF2141 family)
MNQFLFLKVKLMRNSLFLILFMLFSNLLSAQNSFSNTKTLQRFSLEVDKAIKGKGKLFVAVYKGADGFLNTDKAYLLKVVPISDNISKLDLVLEPGEYAIAVYQDVNENGKLDQSRLGLPTEHYGFSNNPKILFGPPAFNACAFRVNQHSNKLSITLK